MAVWGSWWSHYLIKDVELIHLRDLFTNCQETWKMKQYS